MIGILLSLVAGVIPMALYAGLLYYLDSYEKEPLRLVLGVFSWGAFLAAGTAFIVNSISSEFVFELTRSSLATRITTAVLIAPIVEETLKGAAVLAVFLAFRPELDSPLDGFVYAGITALGFAAVENAWYIYQLGYLPDGMRGLLDLTLVRSLLVGWQHPFYSSFIGFGFALARFAQKTILRWIYPAGGWALAVFFHLSHNLLAFFSNGEGLVFWDWSGYIGLLILMVFLINREQSWMKTYLTDERDLKLITSPQYETACSAWRQSLSVLRGLFQGNQTIQRRFYQTCGDLMHKKRQLVRMGEGTGAALEIQSLQKQLVLLSKTLQSHERRNR